MAQKKCGSVPSPAANLSYQKTTCLGSVAWISATVSIAWSVGCVSRQRPQSCAATPLRPCVFWPLAGAVHAWQGGVA